MNKIIYYLITITCTITAVILTSCSESEELMFNIEKPGVYFYKLNGQEGIDSLDYSFVISPASVLKDTLDEELRVRIMGQAAPYDREINLKVDDSSTAIRGEHFDFPNPLILPANAFEVYVPVYLYRTEDLKESVKTIYLTLAESEDFIVGFQGNKQHIIKVTDMLTRPSDWYGGLTDLFYGTYSMRKHEFMVQTLGTTNITFATGAAISQMMAFQQKMLVEIVKYEAENGPMIDENGNRVTFPN